jgi:hypothetical protein
MDGFKYKDNPFQLNLINPSKTLYGIVGFPTNTEVLGFICFFDRQGTQTVIK